MEAILRCNTHGMNLYQARIAIDSSLRKAGKGVYRIRVIHGYNSGTEIKEMIWSEYQHHPKIKRLAEGGNGGETDLVLREL